MILYREVWFINFLVACAWKTDGQRIITWPSIAHRYNSAYIRSVNSSITQPQNLSFTVEADYLHDICEDFVHLDVKIPQTQRMSSMNLINRKWKVSDFIKKSMKNNFFKLFYQAAEQYTNLPNKCPIPATNHMSFRNFTFDADRIPIIVPEFNFLVIFKLVRPNADIALEVIIKGRLKCKERRGFDCVNRVKHV